jgi:cell division inhibitor SepF
MATCVAHQSQEEFWIMPENSGLLKKVMSFFSFESEEGEMDEATHHVDQRERAVAGSDRAEKVVPIARRMRHTEISIYSPATFDEARIAADNLKEGRAVVLNLSRIDVENGKRIVDFLSGILYALEGSSKKVGENIFLFAPANIAITPEEEAATSRAELDSFFFQER